MHRLIWTDLLKFDVFKNLKIADVRYDFTKNLQCVWPLKCLDNYLSETLKNKVSAMHGLSCTANSKLGVLTDRNDLLVAENKVWKYYYLLAL